MDIGKLFSTVFSDPLLNALMLLFHLFGDFALAVVVLTIVIKLILFPLTLKQLRSTKAMQAIAPQMQELKKKYGKDQQGLAVATQQLYKDYGINPLAGCLPMLVQLPVLYGLYFAFRTVIDAETKSGISSLNSHLYFFVPKFVQLPNVEFGWFHWLSFLNPLLHVNWTWGFSLAYSDPTHILPIIAGLATFISLRMSQPKQLAAAQTAAKSGTPDPTASTMKTMQYIMPLFTVFIGWSVPSGLALYWTVSSIFQAVQQYFVTGWGALLTTPKFTTPPATSTRAEARVVDEKPKRERQREVISEVNDEGTEDSEETSSNAIDGPIARELRTPSYNTNGGTSNYTRRRQQPRNSSASARRRSSAQRSRG